jgi:thiamine biosynthesis lipoprotein
MAHLSDSFRRARLGLAIALLAAPACASAQRQPDPILPMGRAFQEAMEELPGVVLIDRHIALEGTVRLLVAAPDSASARTAVEQAFAAADSVEHLISHHISGSEVSRINAAAGSEPIPVSPWTEAMLAAALEWAERTGGAFDPTIGPVIDAWGFSETVTVPTNERLEAAQRLVGWSKVRLDRSAHTVLLTEAGMQLELRGLAKGFALDRMHDAMVAAGATSGLVDFDGDLLFFGPGTEGQANLWPIEVPDPYDPTIAFARFELAPGSFSTSSYYDRVIEIEGERYGHLIDPRTGWPVRGLASVSVYAASAVVNDILSTGLFIMGHEAGLRLAEELDGVEAMFVVDAEPGRQSQVITTAGLRRDLKFLEPPLYPLDSEDE